MTIYKFVSLNEVHKAYAVWDGVCLGTRRDGDFVVKLYGVGNFYVEAFYCEESNKILGFKPFTGTALLEPYLSVLADFSIEE